VHGPAAAAEKVTCVKRDRNWTRAPNPRGIDYRQIRRVWIGSKWKLPMLEYLPELQQMLFAPSDDAVSAFLEGAVDLEDLERREAALEDELRRNLQPTLH